MYRLPGCSFPQSLKDPSPCEGLPALWVMLLEFCAQVVESQVVESQLAERKISPAPRGAISVAAAAARNDLFFMVSNLRRRTHIFNEGRMQYAQLWMTS